MRAIFSLAVVAVLSQGRVSHAAPDPACDPTPIPEQVSRYECVHDITIRGMVLGPDAIELEVHKQVPAKDDLALWHAGPDAVCVLLTAYDPDAHECNVDGMASRDATGEFVLSDGNCVIRFSVSSQKVGMRVSGGECGKRYCGGKGVLENADFLKAPETARSERPVRRWLRDSSSNRISGHQAGNNAVTPESEPPGSRVAARRLLTNSAPRPNDSFN